MENQNPTYSTQKEEPVSFPEKPKTMGTPAHPFPKFLPKKIALIILILLSSLFLIGLITTVYNLGRNSVLKELNPTAPVIPPAGPVNQASPTPDPTANWKTYVDSKLMFSVRYPEEITILRKLPEGGVEFVRTSEAKKDFREITRLSIYFRGEKGTDPNDAWKSECPKPCTEKNKNVSINNAVGVKKTDSDVYYLTNTSKTLPVIGLFISPGINDKDFTVFNQILSTFKFK